MRVARMYLREEGENKVVVLTEIEDGSGGKQLFETEVTLTVQTETQSVGRLVCGNDTRGIALYTDALTLANQAAMKAARRALLSKSEDE